MQRVESGTPACHHVSILTREHDRLVHFLEHVFDFRVRYSLEVSSDELAKIMEWSLKAPTVRSTLLGAGDAGMVEVVDAGAGLDGCEKATSRPPVGPFQLCLIVADLRATLDRARAAGADATLGPVELKIGGATVRAGVVSVAGTRFQLTQAAGA